MNTPTGAGQSSKFKYLAHEGSIATGDSSSIHRRSSHPSGSGTRQSIDEVSVFETRIANMMKLFHISKQPGWLVVVNGFALTLFILQTISTVFPAPVGLGVQFFWESPLATVMFLLTGLRTLMTYNIPMSAQYWITLIVFAVQLGALLVIIFTHKLNETGNLKRAAQLRVAVYVFLFLSFLMLMPMAYNHSGWAYCTWSLFQDTDTPLVLRRTLDDENPLGCWEFSGSFTGFMTLLSFVSVGIQSIFAAFWMIVSVETNPIRRWNLFSMGSVYLFVFEIFSNSTYTLFEHAVPGTTDYQTLWIRYVIYAMWNIVLLVYLIKWPPFFNSFMNSFYISILAFRSTLCLITGITNVIFTMMPDLSSNTLAAMSTFAANIGISFVVAIVGMSASAIYHRILTSRVKKQLNEFFNITGEHDEQQEESNGEFNPDSENDIQISKLGGHIPQQQQQQQQQQSLLRDLAKRVNSHELNLAVRFAMGSLRKRESKIKFISDILSMASQMSLENCPLLISGAMFHMFITGTPALTYFSIRRAYTFKHGLLNKLTIWRLMAELVVHHPEAAEDHVVGSHLRDLTVRRVTLQHIVKSLWAAMMSENVNLSELVSLTGMFTKQKLEAEELWRSVLRSHGENPNVLRQYAIFLEDIEADSDTADHYIQEAKSIEDASRRELEGDGKDQHQLPITTASADKKGKSRTRVHPIEYPAPQILPERKMLVFSDSFEIEHGVEGDDLEEGVDDFGFDDHSFEAESSRIDLFRRSTSAHKPRLIQKIVFIILLCLGIAGFFGMFIFTTVSNQQRRVSDFTIDSCRLGDASIDTSRYIRFVQLSNHHEIVPLDDSESLERLVNITRRVMLKMESKIHAFLERHYESMTTLETWTNPNVTIRYPIINSNFSDPNAKTFTEVQDTRIHQFQILHDNIEIMSDVILTQFKGEHPKEIFGPYSGNDNILLTTDVFMALWRNFFRLSYELLDHCRDSIFIYEQETERIVKFNIAGMALFAALQVVIVVTILLILWTVLREKKSVLLLFANAIPKNDVARAYRRVDERLSEISSLLVEESSRFSKLKSSRRVDFFSARNGLWAVFTVLALIVLHIAFIATCITSHMLVIDTQMGKVDVLESAALVKQYSAENNLFHLEYYFDDNMHMASEIIEHFQLTQQSDTRRLLAEKQANLASAVSQMKYGNQFNDDESRAVGFVNSAAPAVNQLMNVGSCVNGSSESILRESRNFFPVFTECIPSVDSLLTRVKMKLSTTHERYVSIWNTSAPDSLLGYKSDDLKRDSHELFLDTGMLIDAIDFMMQEYMDDRSQIEFFITLSEAMFGIGLVLLLFFSVIAFWLYLTLLKRDHAIRQLLNWIPISTLDSVEALRVYVLHHVLSRRTIRHSAVSEDQKTLSILHAAADGIVLLNEEFAIMETNRSMCKQLNMIPAEMIGIKFTEFVAREYVNKLESTMRHLISKRKQIREMFSKAVLAKAGNKVADVRIGGSDRPDGEDSQLDDSGIDNMSAIVMEVDIVCAKSTYPARLSLNAGLLGGRLVITIFVRNITNENKQRELLELEKRNSEKLLLNVLPHKIAVRLKNGEKNIADRFDDVTCLFSDMVNFTEMGGNLSPGELVEMLNTLVVQFDRHTIAFGVEKIKTIGDAFFAVGGLNVSSSQNKEVNNEATKVVSNSAGTMDHPEQMCRLALAMLHTVEHYNAHLRPTNVPPISVRIGIHTGPVTAGVIGTIKYVFDVFGDTVNIASRMESTGVPGQVQLSRQTYQRVFDMFKFKERIIHAKGKGEMVTYLLDPKENSAHAVELGVADFDQDLDSEQLHPQQQPNGEIENGAHENEDTLAPHEFGHEHFKGTDSLEDE